jgi:hypothetical protein
MLAWIAVTIYGLGKTFLWPTMLGIVGERFPRGGALTMGAIGGIGMLSAGLLGTPGIGYKQDRYASQDLRELNMYTYDRYKAAEESGFLFFKKVRGLDGQKVAVVLDGGKTLDRDFQIFQERAGRTSTESIPQPIVELRRWWETVGKPHQEEDREPVEKARIFGGQMALKLTAAVPAFMFCGYLILVIYFRLKGGYTTVDIDAEGSPRSTGHRPSAEEAFEKGEEGLTAGQA